MRDRTSLTRLSDRAKELVVRYGSVGDSGPWGDECSEALDDAAFPRDPSFQDVIALAR